MGEKAEAITAIYKVNLHCQQCWREIKRPLARTQVDMEKNEIRVKGSNLDVLKIHKQIEKLSKKRVDLNFSQSQAQGERKLLNPKRQQTQGQAS
ncbi:Heavy metal-associated isoprenylated plant protein 4, partial [Cucurbita argyrosperma subsp. argyrosperma]